MIIGLLSIVAVLFVSTKLLKWGRNFCRERFEIDILGGARLALSVLSVIGVIVALIYNFATEGNFWDFWDVTKIILLVSSLAGIAYNILKSNRRDVPAILVCLALGVFQGVFGTLGCIGICLTGTGRRRCPSKGLYRCQPMGKQPRTDQCRDRLQKRLVYQQAIM